eukprot:107070-Chlamydomonas_euryale.AAC.1
MGGVVGSPHTSVRPSIHPSVHLCTSSAHHLRWADASGRRDAWVKAGAQPNTAHQIRHRASSSLTDNHEPRQHPTAQFLYPLHMKTFVSASVPS